MVTTVDSAAEEDPEAILVVEEEISVETEIETVEAVEEISVETEIETVADEDINLSRH